ncbi:MAG TPA: serine hydrolase domain-containing protein [Puia sp.]|nr:serine hydrolase domain-containing protein [Puia sp.]
MSADNKILAAEFLDDLIKNYKTPGIQYVALQNDSVLFNHQAGLAEFESNLPVTEKTFFNACSVTKTFTSLSIMQLAEKEKIKLSDKAFIYLDQYSFLKEITVQQLLSHMSGLPNPIPLRWAHLQEEENSFNSDGFIDQVLKANSKLKYQPGEKFSYSNLNYLPLGKIIEKVSGMNYRDYVKKNIIQKINRSDLPVDYLVNDFTNYARGYQKKFTITNAILGFFLDRKKFMEPSSNPKWIRFKKYYVSGRAYGGLIANAYSLTAFIQTLFKPDSVLISDKYKKILLTKQHTNSGKQVEMTLGWFTGNLNGIDYFTHAGAGGGYYCEMRSYPEKKFISAIMFNRSGMSDERFLDKVDSFFL